MIFNKVFYEQVKIICVFYTIGREMGFYCGFLNLLEISSRS